MGALGLGVHEAVLTGFQVAVARVRRSAALPRVDNPQVCGQAFNVVRGVVHALRPQVNHRRVGLRALHFRDQRVQLPARVADGVHDERFLVDFVCVRDYGLA